MAMLLAISYVSGIGGTAFSLAAGPTPITLLSAVNFAVLAGSTITNTGATTVNGDIGLSPGTSITGFPPGIITGTQYINNASVLQAQTDLTAAFTAANQTPVSIVPAELGGTTKIAGVYESVDGSFAITGTLTLDAQNDPNAVFIFKPASTLITGGASNIVLINGAQACHVIWQIGSSATLGTNSIFKGNILALTSATLTTGAQVEGRVLARNGAVTLDSNSITTPVCVTPSVPIVVAPIIPSVVATTTTTAVATTTIPEVLYAATTTPIIVIASSTVFVSTIPALVATSTPNVLAVAPPQTATLVTEVRVLSSPQFPDTGISPYTTYEYWNIVSFFLLMLLAHTTIWLTKRMEVV